MKLVRFGANKQEKPGALDSDGSIRDLSGVVSDIGGATLEPHSLDRLRAIDLSGLPIVSGSPSDRSLHCLSWQIPLHRTQLL
jgi:2,4-didehydro-3-deoxy-L-rhamnonate hydrolase